MRAKVTIVLCMVAAATACAAKPTFLYDVDFVTYFDNREFYDPLQPSQTIFGLRLAPTVGLQLQDSAGGTHTLMAGVSYKQPFGADWRKAKFHPIAYYQYRHKGFSISAGAVPYYNLQHAMPDYLQSDSLAFAYPNIQGALFQYASKWGYAEFFCDWRGMASSDVREAFRLVADGRFRYKWFFAGGYLQMNHLANKSADQPNLGVCDDVYANPFVGFDLTNITPLDSFSIQMGYLMGYQRDRKAEESHLLHGALADIYIGWRFIGLENRLYAGEGQMPLYTRYGSTLNQGNPYYNSKIYNRTDLFIYFVRRPFVTCYFAWNLHYTYGHKLGHQQQFVARFNLGGLKCDKSVKLHGLFDK